MRVASRSRQGPLDDNQQENGDLSHKIPNSTNNPNDGVSRFFLGASRKEPSLANTLTSDPQNYELINECCFELLSSW